MSITVSQFGSPFGKRAAPPVSYSLFPVKKNRHEAHRSPISLFVAPLLWWQAHGEGRDARVIGFILGRFAGRTLVSHWANGGVGQRVRGTETFGCSRSSGK